MSMNSFTRLTMAVFLALSIFGTFTSACSDNADFTTGKKNKTCSQLITEKNRAKKCRSKKISKNCPASCGTCGPLPCPKQQRSPVFKKPSCTDYENDQVCGFKHVWTGCGDGNMQCKPLNKFTCTEESGDKIWKKSKHKKDKCPKPYGDKCDPKHCPPLEPTEGASCSWFKSPNSKLHGSTCGYEPEWVGCFFGSLTCQYSRQYTCDPLTQVWVFNPLIVPKCLPQPGVPDGEPCDIDNPIEPTKPKPTPKPEPTFPPITGGATPCPEEEPTSGGCTDTEGECDYNPVIMGCTLDTMRCSPISSYSCDNGIWIVRMFAVEFCEDPDLPFGEACDPDTFDPSIYFDLTPSDSEDPEDPKPRPPLDPRDPPPEKEYKCPESPPRQDTDCGDEPHPPTGCGYGYTIQGCEFKDLGCVPGEVATCEMTGMPTIVTDPVTGEDIIQMDMNWRVATAGVEFCLDVPEDWPAGGSCDPETFDKNDYINPLTPSEDSGDEPECPAISPNPGDRCDGEMTCGYGYTVRGCSPLELSCGAIEVAFCRPGTVLGKRDGEYVDIPGFVWSVMSESAIEDPCGEDVPGNWIHGQACDLATFDPKQALDVAGVDLGFFD